MFIRGEPARITMRQAHIQERRFYNVVTAILNWRLLNLSEGSPAMKLEKHSLSILEEAIERMEEGFATLPDVSAEYDGERLQSVLLQVATRMQDNYPYFHPQYAGQMLKPPHPVARIAYMLAMWVNPNN
ncbi:MAG TPA: hypothetical protein ENL12_02925, partial [Dehalococcoidia bacterium]|nr:hypothetical protein [Dehalococcoidia bacterium]